MAGKNRALGKPDIRDLIEVLVENRVSEIETTMPGIVVSFDASQDPPRADIDLAIKGARTSGDGTETYTMPRLVDVPVLYPSGGGATIYWPLQAGDEVLVHSVARDMDNALETGERSTEPGTSRRHHLMDSVAVPSAWSRPGAVPSASRGAALILNHESEIKVGAGATQHATTAQKVLDTLAALEGWMASHVHSLPSPLSVDTEVPTTSPPGATLGGLSVTKVKLE